MDLSGIFPEIKAGFDSGEDVKGNCDNESVVCFTEAPPVNKSVKVIMWCPEQAHSAYICPELTPYSGVPGCSGQEI